MAPPLQYFCLETPMDGGAWWATVHGVVKTRTRLSNFTFTFHFHALEKEMATHSSVLASRIPGMGEPGGLLSMGSHRVGHDWSDLAAIYWYTKHYVTCHLVLINLYFNLQAYKLGTIHLIFQIRKLLDKSHNFPSCLTITQVCLTVKSNRWVLVLVSWTKQSTSAKWI